jgi:large subunit ribosomal protein L10
VVLRLDDKKAIVAEVAAVASTAVSAAIADYRGLTVAKMNELRVKARDSNVYLKVVRNTLARRAVQGTAFACLDPALVGSLVLAFARAEPSATAKLFKDFAKQNESFTVKGLSLDGQFFSAAQIDALASLPTRDEAIAQLMSVMTAPISKFVQTMSAVPTKLVRTVAAVRDQKQES